MNDKKFKYPFYIRGVKGKGREVRELLEAKGGCNVICDKEKDTYYENESLVFFINNFGNIFGVDNENEVALLLIDYCEELKLPQQKLRSYRNVEQFLEAEKNHGGWLYNRETNHYARAIFCGENCVYMMERKDSHTTYSMFMLVDLLCRYIWLDGSPCGLME